MQIFFFEDKTSRRLKPLTLTRPVWDLRVGIQTIYEKWDKTLQPGLIAWETQDHLKKMFPSLKIDIEKSCYYINSRYLPSKELKKAMLDLKAGEAIFDDEHLVAAYSNVEIKSFSDPDVYSLQPIQARLKFISIEYIWDILRLNGNEISNDIQLLECSFDTDLPDNVIISNQSQIFISESAKVEPGAVLLADDGPIFIGENTTIESGSILRGNVAVCDNATTKMYSRIYNGSTIGPHCKVGGEVSNTVFHSYSNKAHDGFVGNSIFGQWCNLGADTNTSNLKNNYSIVHLQDWDTKQPYKEGVQFLGTVMGDHSKTSINTMLNTGTICGVSSNIFCAGFPPKYIPSFTWLDGQENPVFKFEKALEVMKAVMARRSIKLTPAYQQLIEAIFKLKN